MSQVNGWRRWLSRVRGMPARTERIDRVSKHLDAASHSLLASAGEAAVTADALQSRLQRLESDLLAYLPTEKPTSEVLKRCEAKVSIGRFSLTFCSFSCI